MNVLYKIAGFFVEPFWVTLNCETKIQLIKSCVSIDTGELEKAIRLYPRIRRFYATEFAYNLAVEGRRETEIINLLRMHSRFI